MELGRYNKTQLIHGIGVNDLDYVAQKNKRDKSGKLRVVWRCPYYSRWVAVLLRTNSEEFKIKNPNYSECTLDDRWKYLSNFKSWMETQDWEGKHLDKDLLIPGNKVYGPDTCIFVSRKVNNFIMENRRSRGDNPIGVCYHKDRHKHQATCGSIDEGYTYLGLYDTPEEAHKVWLDFKLSQAYILAERQTDPRVAKALIDRYENYHKYFPNEGL